MQSAAKLLGKAPCEYALLALGSTSRNDKMPYSDIELALLYSTKSSYSEIQICAYTEILSRLLELYIINLGETPPLSVEKVKNIAVEKIPEGFRLDISTIMLARNELRTTPLRLYEEAIEQKIKQHANNLLNDESIYSSLNSILINDDDEEAVKIFDNYTKLINKFLDKPCTEQHIRQLTEEVKIKLRNQLKETFATVSPAADSQFIIDKVLQYYDEEHFAVDIKKAYYKPLANLALNLKLFYNSPISKDKTGKEKCHPHDIFKVAEQRRLITLSAYQLLQSA